MLIYECDRCHEKIDSKSIVPFKTRIIKRTLFVGRYETELDLCQSCYTKFKGFMEGNNDI